jgi:signal transduction histidine kinase
MIHYQNLTTSIIIASAIALFFTPLKNRIQDFVDRAFFKATPMEIANQNEKLKAVATLASGLAHEIKNPLTTLKTFAEYVPQKKDDPEFMEQYKKIIPQEITRIDNLVHELLFFAKPSPPQIQSINPNEIIRNTTLMLDQKFKSQNIQVALQLNANTSVQADPNQIKQALLNLILNAIDAMPNGGKLGVIARSEATKQSLSTVIPSPTNVIPSPTNVIPAKAGIYVIEITDTGCGIAPKDLPHIFEPFFTKKEKGTGLGLAITQGIIEKHGGTINVESKINQGTKFIIKLPVG